MYSNLPMILQCYNKNEQHPYNSYCAVKIPMGNYLPFDHVAT